MVAGQETRILVVDDDAMLCRQLQLYLDKMGQPCTTAETFAEGMQHAELGSYDVIFLDVNLPDFSGLNGIEVFKALPGAPDVIIITSDSDPDGAELAVRNGAWYYMEKPLSFNSIKLILGRVLQYREHSRRGAQQFLAQRAGLVGQDPKFLACLQNVALAARSGGNVLVSGETGTGKELVARAIHDNSGRAKNPFVVVDCTNIPETLAENILFGHEKGAFTDARERRQGMVAQAHGGTLFLDEVGDLPYELQRSLLRVIQEKRYRMLGGDKEYAVDVRFLAATNRNIASMVEEGEFRMDLFYRLAAFHIKVPPLRERKSDIKLLVRHFLDDICQEQGLPYKGVSNDFMEALHAHEWPGNVRELINVVQGAVTMASSEPVLYPHHFPTDFKAQYFRAKTSASEAAVKGAAPPCAPAEGLQAGNDLLDGPLPLLKEFREKYYSVLEARYLDRLIPESGGDVKLACKLAGISRSRLYQLLDKHGRRMQASSEG